MRNAVQIIVYRNPKMEHKTDGLSFMPMMGPSIVQVELKTLSNNGLIMLRKKMQTMKAFVLTDGDIPN